MERLEERSGNHVVYKMLSELIERQVSTLFSIKQFQRKRELGLLLAVKSHGDKRYELSLDGTLLSSDTSSKEVNWSMSTRKALHLAHQSSKCIYTHGLMTTSETNPVDHEFHANEVFTKPLNYYRGYLVRSTLKTKIYVNPETGLRLSTPDSPSDDILCIARFDIQFTLFKRETNIVMMYLRLSAFDISIVNWDGVRWHEKNDVPRNEPYLLTQHIVSNITCIKGSRCVIYIENGQRYDDVKKEVNIVVCNGNINIRKVCGVESGQDSYNVSTEHYVKCLREFIPSCNDHKRFLKLIRGIVTGFIGLHDKRIFFGHLDMSDIFVDNHSNVKISVKPVKPIFPLISSSTGATGYVNFADEMLALGGVIFFCYTGFEYNNENLNNRNRRNYLKPIYDCSEALDLLRKLLDKDPAKRPTAEEVYNHPLFWDPDTNLSFIRDVRVRLREEVPNSNLLIAIENIKPDVFVKRWDTYIDGIFLKEMNKHCRYNYWRVHDLIRFIRNDATYNRKRPGFNTDLHTEFPELVIKLYNVMQKHCRGELLFKPYFKRTPL